MTELELGSSSLGTTPAIIRAGILAKMLRAGRWLRAGSKRTIWLSIMLLAGLAAYRYVNSPQNVHVVPVKTVTTAETIGATGKIRGEKVADLGLDVTGVVRRIYVRAGDKVRSGTVLLSLDTSEMNAKTESADDAVRSADAELARASRGPLSSDIGKARADLEQATLVGQAKVAQAEAHLRDLQAGSRSQEVLGAQVELQRREQLLAKAESDYKRNKELVDLGAVAQSILDAAKTDVDTARTSVAAQQQEINLLKAGSRPDQSPKQKQPLQRLRRAGIPASDPRRSP